MGKPILRYEAGQSAQPFEETTDGGDNTTFSASFSPISKAAGHEPVIAPYGLLTGGAITVDTGTNDSVDIAALTVQAPGMTGANSSGVVTVGAGTVSITRAVSTDTHIINSITVDSSGALAAVAGTDGTSFVETRGAAGGPPYIPVGSVEIGQVRTTSFTAAEVLSTEIFQVAGTHLEKADYPGYDVDYALGTLTFHDALPLIHTGDLPKKVYIKGSTPIFAPIKSASDWVPAEASNSVSSTDTYDGAVNSVSESLSQSSFTFQSDDGMSDDIISKKGQDLWFEYRRDRDKTVPKQYTQGILAVSRSNPTSGKVPVACTVSASQGTVDVLV